MIIWQTHPMNMKSTMPAVMRAPLLAGDSMPNIANTVTEEESRHLVFTPA